MSPPIYTPDGAEVSEIVLPDGSTASEVIGPDGNVVFEAGADIPDSENLQIQWDIQKEDGFSDGDEIYPTDHTGSIDLDGGNGATYKASGFNGYPVARLDGSDDLLVASNSNDQINYMHDGSGATMYLIIANYSLSGGFGRLIYTNNSSNNVGFVVGEDDTNGELFHTISNGSNRSRERNISFSSNILTWTHGSSRSPDWQAFEQRSSMFESDYGISPSSSNAANDLTLNGQPSGGGDIGFDLLGALFYDTVHESKTRSDVWDYIEGKWDMA